MRTFLLVAAALAVTATPVLAHPGGHDGEEQAQTPDRVARAVIIRMITQSKLSASWSGASLVGTRERNVKGVHQTVVTFRNDTELDAGRKFLHVALDQEGELISATHAL